MLGRLILEIVGRLLIALPFHTPRSEHPEKYQSYSVLTELRLSLSLGG
jgi:hypothetical protein